jgi:hypothetical protein
LTSEQRNILILSDSLALPREVPEYCGWEDTWPSLLRKASGMNVHQLSIGGATVTDLLKQVSYYAAMKPAVVILQVGIVDCAPRFLSRTELNAINLIPAKRIRKWLLSSLNTPRFRKVRNLTYTPITKFERALSSIQQGFSTSSVYALGILSASQQYEQLLPGISQNIQRYNSVLTRCFDSRYIHMTEFPTAGLMSDHHHVNSTGHQFICDKILKVIEGDNLRIQTAETQERNTKR